jgi:hypothetical protein
VLVISGRSLEEQNKDLIEHGDISDFPNWLETLGQHVSLSYATRPFLETLILA